MEPQDLVDSLQALAGWLAEEPAPSLADRARLFRRLVVAVQSLHDRGRLHASIDAAHVLVRPGVEPVLVPASSPRQFGAGCSDLDSCPPDLADVATLDVPDNLEAASAVLAGRGIRYPATRIDVYQLGALLCRLFGGETVVAYMYDAEVKQRIPAPFRSVVDRALGHESATRLTDCGQLLEVLDGAIGQVVGSAGAQPWSETPRRGSILTPRSDTPVVGRAPAPAASGSAGDAGLSGSRLGHFRVGERIGRGGMGDVYKAYDESLERFVAIKVLPPELARDDEFVRRFRAEAVAAAKIGHPNIVPVHFIGQEQGVHFFAMQFVEGESLAQRLHRVKRLSVDEATAIVQQCLGALQAAHSRGLVHRDVKPGNILLEAETGRALLVDFGLVRAVGSTRMTTTGTVMGTVDYIAPEQARGQTVDGRADIYALGAVFYELLAGRLPFLADSPAVMIFRHAYEPPFPLSEAAPDVPEPLRAVVGRMMAKPLAERYQSCAEVSEDLCACREGRPLASAPPLASSRATAILLSPALGPELEPPAQLAQLTAARRLGRLRDWAATIFRRHAPDFVKNLQSTSQWVDSAVEEYDRRYRRLAKLAAEAREVIGGLTEDIAHNRQAAAEAAKEAETAGDEHDRLAALTRGRRYQENVAALVAQQEQQQREIEEIEIQCQKAQATLARLRSQRDVLQARLKMANLRQDVALGRTSRQPRRLPAAVIVLGAAVISVAGAVLLAWYRERPRFAATESKPQDETAYYGPYSPSQGALPAPRPAPRQLTEDEVARRTLTNSIGMEMIQVPAGQFLMGTDKRDIELLAEQRRSRRVLDAEHGPNETPAHTVRISKPFYLGKFEVTQKEYAEVMGSNPSKLMAGFQRRNSAESAPTVLSVSPSKPAAGPKGDAGAGPPATTDAASKEFLYYPVDNVGYDLAMSFCKKLSARDEEKKAGRVYRLPTEAEWEYACRAGTQTAFSFGDYVRTSDANLAHDGWDGEKSQRDAGTAPVGSHPPNPFGLFDMHGNVWEWCSDFYGRSYYAQSPVADPCNRTSGGQHVLRGGSFADQAVACRSAFRGHGQSTLGGASPTGFRVVCELVPVASESAEKTDVGRRQ